jgi:hypothetical protein
VQKQAIVGVTVREAGQRLVAQWLMLRRRPPPDARQYVGGLAARVLAAEIERQVLQQRSMQRVADKVFLLTPRNVEVSAEEKEAVRPAMRWRRASRESSAHFASNISASDCILVLAWACSRTAFVTTARQRKMDMA